MVNYQAPQHTVLPRAALPAQRSTMCTAGCYGGLEVCDGVTACWARRLEDKGAAQRAKVRATERPVVLAKAEHARASVPRTESAFDLYRRRERERVKLLTARGSR